ncbi:MAG: 3-oxoacyl-ACP synthase [Spirochaetes bacterium]|nr:3-oxoacyl-ACP synthase [Spirochaetota bacterium]
MKEIYLSAPGLICCAGQNKDELYASCLKGNQEGIKMMELPDGRQLPAGLVITEKHNIPYSPVHKPFAYTGGTKIIRLIDAALEQIRTEIENAISRYGADRIGVCLGSCDNGSEASILAHKALLENGAFPADYNLRFQSASFAAEFIAAKFGLEGPVMTTATACASGASAIVRGAELIRSRLCDAVIAGGADIVSQTVLLGFYALEALSSKLTNPFSKNRDGINLGEGAAFFLLDSLTQSGGIELLGYGESCDAHHMTAPGNDGIGPAKAMKAALADAGVEPSQIGYVNLHGTGTLLNDKAEALAMKDVFSELTPPSSSTKPITGHTIGAAGALETAICWMTLNMKNGLPVHCWDGEKDEELPFHPYTHGREPPSICMNNNFAFGGYNVSLILGRSKPLDQ